MKRSKRRFWLGFDLGGTKMMAAVFDGDCRLLASARAKTKGVEGAAPVLKRIKSTIEEALKAAKISPRDLAGIGVGAPGPLDLDRGIILHAPNLGWHNVRLKDALERAFKCPAIVANDVDAGTYAEFRFGAARGARCVLGVFPGTGIGGSCISQGRILRGRKASAMEIGHIEVDPGGRLCGCGHRGCLETVASRLAIAAEAAAAVHRGEAPVLARLAGTDLAGIKSGTLAKAIRAGDEAVESIVRHAAHRLGRAVGSVVNLLAPDVVVLGGGLVQAMPALWLKETRRGILDRALKDFLPDLRITAAKLGDDATVMGAAALAADEAGSGRPGK
jgi:glucokinase